MRSEGEKYRFGYQGEFAEQDDETGWNAFELRMYDSKIGRWMAPDPYRVGYSPYIGMANSPISRIDVDGGCPDGDCPEDYWNFGEVIDLESVTIHATQSWTEKIGSFISSLDFVAEGNASLDIGLRARFKGNIAGWVSITADVNVVNLNLASGVADLTNLGSKDAYSYDYAGRDGYFISNSIGVTVKTALPNKPGVGFYAEQHQRVHGAGQTEGYGKSLEWDLLLISGRTKDKKIPGRTPYGAFNVGKKKDFIGIDVGAGAQLILGFDVGIKVGFNY